MLLPLAAKARAHHSLTGASDHHADHAPCRGLKQRLLPQPHSPVCQRGICHRGQKLVRVAAKSCRFPPACDSTFQQESDIPGVDQLLQPDLFRHPRRAHYRPGHGLAQQPGQLAMQTACHRRHNQQGRTANSKMTAVVEPMGGSGHLCARPAEAPRASRCRRGWANRPPPRP